MTPKLRAEGLAAASRVARTELLHVADRIAQRDAIAIVEPPAAGTVLMQVESALGGFSLGEVVVTTCTVKVADQDGWGAVVGMDREGALAAALADAVADDEVSALCTEALRREHKGRLSTASAVASTKVNFG